MNNNKITNILLAVVALLLGGIFFTGLSNSGASESFGAGQGPFVPREFIITKELTSSAIASSTATDITVPAQGDLIIDNIIVQTDATGLAGGTTFTISTDNAIGTTTVFAHAVSGLGANATLDMYSATTKQRTVLKDGKKLTVKCSVADCTGAGKIYITTKLIKASPTATIYD